MPVLAGSCLQVGTQQGIEISRSVRFFSLFDIWQESPAVPALTTQPSKTSKWRFATGVFQTSARLNMRVLRLRVLWNSKSLDSITLEWSKDGGNLGRAPTVPPRWSAVRVESGRAVEVGGERGRERERAEGGKKKSEF